MATDVPFSARFTNIIAITKHLTSQGQDAATAKSNATQIEGQFLQVSDTKDDYQELCDDYVTVHSALSAVIRGDEGSDDLTTEPKEMEEVFNQNGPKFGKYEWATFHADGVTSTIYKARPIQSTTEALEIESVVALKVVAMDQLQQPHNVRKEVRVLQRSMATDAHIVPLLESFQQPGGTLVLVFPFLRQDLENLLRSGRLSKQQSGMVFHGLFAALAHLHSVGIVHRDIKPGNVLLKSMDGPVYLIDFGIAWDPQDPDSEAADKKITDVGTTCYRAPEILFGCRDYGTAFDMWAAGCVVAEIVRKQHDRLFDGGAVGSELGLIKSIFSTLGTPNDHDWPSAKSYPDWGKVKFQDFQAHGWQDILPETSEAARDFVSRTVCYEPTARLTAAEALQHVLAHELG